MVMLQRTFTMREGSGVPCASVQQGLQQSSVRSQASGFQRRAGAPNRPQSACEGLCDRRGLCDDRL